MVGLPAIMEQKESKKRKCGPRVKTGCITCRIRRVKCDEAKPACQRCTSTGRKCDGYTQVQQKVVEKAISQPIRPHSSLEVAQPLSLIFAMPFSMPGKEKERQFFHFYCVQSAFDLSVYLNSSFWYNIILQYSQQFPVVRQAVVAFGASHTFALHVNSKSDVDDAIARGYEQAKQYDKAIRHLRSYIEADTSPDPHVILICCALFFSCENGLGNREAALQHLERGLSIINAEQQKRLPGPISEADLIQSDADHQACCRGTDQPNKNIEATEIDEELLYVFSRLDCQATLCQEDREPVLDLDILAQTKNSDDSRDDKFLSIADAQQSLDILQNRLARFLTRASPYKEDTAETLPIWVVEQKKILHAQCARWEDAMNTFVATQSDEVKYILRHERTSIPRKDSSWELASQIQLLVLHHRCWWMLFRSSYPHNLTVFTMSPNPRAEEILDICEVLGFSLPVRPSASANMSEADVSWKLISEIGVAAPLFVLATKCTDPSVQTRARKQLEALREYRNGVYDKLFLTKVIQSIAQQNENLVEMKGTSSEAGEDHGYQIQSATLTDTSQSDSFSFCDSENNMDQLSRSTTVESTLQEEPRELLGWGRRSSLT